MTWTCKRSLIGEGIRLAVGARSSDILSQFLAEAIVQAMPIARSVSVLIGVLFGVFPVRKAAHLNPLAALRFE